jgi:hypothetical protein
MLISVTNDDINYGTPQSPCNCPVSRALSRIFEERVNCWSSGFTLEKSRRKYNLPYEVGPKIRRYDMGFGMNPFEFEIDEKVFENLIRK